MFALLTTKGNSVLLHENCGRHTRPRAQLEFPNLTVSAYLGFPATPTEFGKARSSLRAQGRVAVATAVLNPGIHALGRSDRFYSGLAAANRNGMRMREVRIDGGWAKAGALLSVADTEAAQTERTA